LTELKDKYLKVYEPDIMFLQILGTLPEYRRRGYGGTLVKWGIERATVDNVPLSLDAGPQGVALYKSLGFCELGKQIMQAPDEEEFLTSIAMLWEHPTVDRKRLQSL
jgi:ribosomal protein S18 acetylase RimI-like enzyme